MCSFTRHQLITEPPNPAINPPAAPNPAPTGPPPAPAIPPPNAPTPPCAAALPQSTLFQFQPSETKSSSAIDNSRVLNPVAVNVCMSKLFIN